MVIFGLNAGNQNTKLSPWAGMWAKRYSYTRGVAFDLEEVGKKYRFELVFEEDRSRGRARVCRNIWQGMRKGQGIVRAFGGGRKLLRLRGRGGDGKWSLAFGVG